VLRNRNLIGHELDAVRRRTATSSRESDGLAVDQQRSTPDAVRLAPDESAFETMRAEHAGSTDRLRSSDVEIVVGEEEVGKRPRAIRASSTTDKRWSLTCRIVGLVIGEAQVVKVRFSEHDFEFRAGALPGRCSMAQTDYSMTGHWPKFHIVPACRSLTNYGQKVMGRLCERPGCSDTAGVAYGMRTEDLVFWLDVITDGSGLDGGVLCQRHADSMVVPRGWTLDDLRDPDLHLFRPPARPDAASTPSRRKRSSSSSEHSEQLALGGVADAPQPNAEISAQPVVEQATAEPVVDTAGESVDVELPSAEAWKPNFDADDDLDGLLSASSPLLSRAFRGADRPD
jgi:hypothetical protein